VEDNQLEWAVKMSLGKLAKSADAKVWYRRGMSQAGQHSQAPRPFPRQDAQLVVFAFDFVAMRNVENNCTIQPAENKFLSYK
jgi:hypothetical protein